MSGGNNPRPTSPAPAVAAPPDRYAQQLRRGMKVAGNVLITLSGITPAVSVFVIAPVAFKGQGSGAFLAYIIAAIIGVGMAMSWGELGSAYPIAGGDYSIAARVLGRFTGFLMFVLFLVLMIFVPSSIALGGAAYISVVYPGANPNLIGALIIIVTALVAMLTIRVNAIFTGIFLAVEMAALVVVVVLGFGNAQNASYLVSPHLFSGSGTATAASFGLVGAGVAVAIFSYNGYNAAINFSEETSGPPKGIAKAVYLAFGLTIAAELIPVTAALVGAPSLGKLANSANPMGYLLGSLGGHDLDVAVSIGIFLAVINATLAIILTYARMLYSSGRDGAWPGPVSTWMSYVHPRFKSPWFATAVVGAIGAVLTGLSSIAALVTFTGVVLAVDYGLIAVAAIVSRLRQPGLARPHKMPLWPVPALVGLAGIIYTLTQQTVHDLVIVAIILACGTVYYVAYLRPRGGARWVMRDSAQGDADDEPGAGRGAAMADGAPRGVPAAPEVPPGTGTERG